MNRITPPDIAARLEIENNLDMNLLVEAGAGSGKTTSLVKRMISLVASSKCTIDKIAAITFTKKAAQELKERFQNKLEERCQKEQDESLRAVLKNALDNIEQCYIGTIHSFCATMLRERPVEAGIDPDFIELDDMGDELVHQEAWPQYLIEVKTKDPGKLLALDDVGLKPADLFGIYKRISAYPDVEVASTPVARPDLKPVFEKLKPLLFATVKYIPATEPENGYDKLQENIKAAVRMIRFYDMSRDSNIAQVLDKFDGEKKVTYNRWLVDKKIIKEQVEAAFANLSLTEISPALERWKEYCHYVAMQFLLPAVEHYEQVKRKKSSLNFQDLLMKTAQMLRKYGEVRSYFQNKYERLLVDEFQDTDPIQAEIMFLLTGTDTDGKDWQKLAPAPGRLFVVGDPKQSIYRFRRADIDIYHLVKRIILETGGKVLELTSNFRSVNVLGDWYKKAFKSLLPSEASTYQAAYSPIDTLKEDQPGMDSGVRIVQIPPDFGNKEEIAGADADYIARIIRQAVDNKSFQLTRSDEDIEAGLTPKPEFRDFLILLRYKDGMDVYARTLESYGIPVRMTGGSSLSQVEEINELTVILNLLRDPDNQVLLLAALRGMFFGISDAALAQYKLAGGKFTLYAKYPDSLDKDIRSLFENAYEKLNLYRKWTRSYPAITALEKICMDLGLIPLTLSGPLSQTGCGYIYKIMEMLRNNAEAINSFSALTDQLEVILESDLKEELDLSCEDKNAVRLMNLHLAKGLEAPVVFLAHPDKRIDRKPDYHVTRSGTIRNKDDPQSSGVSPLNSGTFHKKDDPQSSGVSPSNTSKGYFLIKKAVGFHQKTIGQPVNWSEYEAVEQEYQSAEEIRLLYVAATRAKNLLFISSQKNNSKNAWEPLLDYVQKEEAEYSIPAVLKPQPEETTFNIGIDQLESASQETNSYLDWAKEPTYGELSPSDILKQEALHTLKGGYGADWGTAIHSILEMTVRDEGDVYDYAAATLDEQSFTGDEYMTAAVTLVDEYKQSELFSRIQNASEKLTEVPFVIHIDPQDPLYSELNTESKNPITLSGVIDLAIKEADGWSIIDYKTNYFETDDDLKLLVEHYTKQIKLYCGIWERISEENVVSGELYFTRKGLVKVFQKG